MKIKTDSAPEKVVKRILKEIESHQLKPDDQLPNYRELAGKYGVGISTIREAINALAVMDKVVVIQGKGTFIKNPPPEENALKEADVCSLFRHASVYNLMEIREVLECHAVQKAAEVISEEQIVVLQEVFERLENSYGEEYLYLTEDIAFHVEIARAGKNPLLGELLKIIHLMVNQKTSVIFQTASSENICNAIVTARQVLNFIIAGEGGRAQRCMREHLAITKEIILKTLLDERLS